MEKYKLCVTEKPSVAKDIAAVIGADEKHDGYISGNGYVVTWCLGHLVTLCEPEEYDDIYKDRNNMDVLPIIPDEFKTKIIPEPGKRKQFGIIKKLINSPDCELVIDCGDMGSQGHYLQWLVREKAGCTKPVKRFTATSLTKESIKQHMQNLHDIDEFEGVIEGAYCMAKTHWIYGMTFSRLYSSKYKAAIRVGLVKSPTLYMVTKRYLDVCNFKPENYYQVEALMSCNGTDFTADYNNKEKFSNAADAESICADIRKYKCGVITEIKKTTEQKQRPLLYDITQLQRDGDMRYGYTPEQVLKAAQVLYERHLITYPRTDSCYITYDLAPYMEERVHLIGKTDGYTAAAECVLKNGLVIDRHIVNDSKVTDHHAILITEEYNPEYLKHLSKTEADILELVMERMLVAFSKPYVYEKTVLSISVMDYKFTASGTVPSDRGYKDVLVLLGFDNVFDKTENIFSGIKEQDTVNIYDVQAFKKTTKPPKLYTYRSLLSAMENVGKDTKNERYKKALNARKGIGTQATRAGILSELIDLKYIEYKFEKKTRYLVPTEKGMSIIKVLDSELINPELTAECELMIKKIEEGKFTVAEYMEYISGRVKGCVSRASASSVSEEDLKFAPAKKYIGECIFCSGRIVAGKHSFYCENLSDRGCFFYIDRNNPYFIKRTGKNLTEKNIQNLISKKGEVFKCKSAAGKDYKLRIWCKDSPEVINGRKYVGFDSEFA